MKESDLSRQFVEFEKKNNLFDLTDTNGVYIWDIIRYDLYNKLKWSSDDQPVIKKTRKNMFRVFLIRFVSLFQFIRDSKKYENFFYLCSRNVKNGLLFDQNAFSVINSFDPGVNFLFETFSFENGKLLFNSSFYNFPQFLHRKFYRDKSAFDYSFILEKIMEEFGVCPLDVKILKTLVRCYYSDLAFFKKLFRRKGIKRVFVTQNGIQKGLFSAAIELNIPSYEFQHGIVNYTHMAYSYPDIVYKPGQVYLPNIIFSLSEYWYKDLNLPLVNIHPLGNDFFSEKIADLDFNCNDITIISANVFGLQLSSFLLRYIDEPFLRDRKIYFKMHPNQFHEKEYYEIAFKSYANVEVITNEYSVAALLSKSQILLTIESTAVYEALQAGRKVFLLKEGNDIRHKDLSSNDNIYWVKDKDDLINALNSDFLINPVEFFSPFNKQILKNAFIECETKPK